MFRTTLSISVLTLLVLAAHARGADAGPVADTASRLTAWLCGRAVEGDVVVSPDATAQDLTRGRSIAPAELAARFTDSRVLASAVYAGGPKTLASDLSVQLKQLDDAPAASLRALAVEGPKAKAADEVSAEWVADVLKLKPGESTGVIVLWHVDAAADSATASTDELAAAPQQRLVMILYKTTVDASGRERVTRLVYTVLSDAGR